MEHPTGDGVRLFHHEKNERTIGQSEREGADWEHELVDDGPGREFMMDLKFSPGGKPSLSYTTTAGLKYAIKP